MDIFQALTSLGGIAKTQQLHQLGIKNWQITATVERGSVIRLRKGWYGLHTIRPIERRAIIDRGFLTCASAAMVMGFPYADNHYHLRTSRASEVEKTNCRRARANRFGSCVSMMDWVEDYLHCQAPEWSIALLDSIERRAQLTPSQWRELRDRLPAQLRKLLDARSNLPESPLESLMRFKLDRARLPFSMQVNFGKYRADFVVGTNLIIETHGAEHHASKFDWERDRERVLWFRSNGWDVLEVSFNQVVEWDSVYAAIRKIVRRK
jgi:very-short-patch-repair endonuclease